MADIREYHLLFPGRHHILTNTQSHYLSQLVTSNLIDLLDFNQKPLNIAGSIRSLIWAVTSANHTGTKRNPLPFNRREAMITDFTQNLPINSLIYHIDDVGVIDNFPQYICKKIANDTDMSLFLTPENTIVISSTPEIAQGYMNLGFKVLPLEWNENLKTWTSLTPFQILEHIVALSIAGKDLRSDSILDTNIHISTKKIFDKYDYRQKIKLIQQDKILFPNGDLTETRDYNTYGRSFDEGGIRKYQLIQEDIEPGVIVDIGCCTGSLLKHISKEEKHHESDLYGIDIVPKFIQTCETDKLMGRFGNEHVFFMQKNAIDTKIFPDNFVDNFITTALTHEIVSYDGFEKLNFFTQSMMQQLKPGGKWINVDVVGPENPDEIVIAELNTLNGENYDEDKANALLSAVNKNYKTHKSEFIKYVSELSTYSKFLFFVQTFRAKQKDYTINYTIQSPGKIKIRMQDIAEFMSKKDYNENRLSEMNEKFCFWSTTQWEDYLKKKGFNVVSTPIYNEWIYKNRYEGCINLADVDGKTIPYPATNVKQIITKPKHYVS